MICDVSAYQGAIDWGQLRSSIDFVILRSSVGTKVDTRYREYVSGCTRYGIPYHAYHYIKATTEAEARDEAKVCATALWGTSPLFVVIDAEYSGIKASSARAICEAFEAGLRHYIANDIRVALYIGHHLYRSWALDYSRYAYVWIPRYGKNSGQPESRPDYPCDLWQYTSRGRLTGINGDVDLDMLTGTKPMEFFIGKSTDEPTTSGGDINMFTGEQFAVYCEHVYQRRWVYWYGTYGQKCTQSLYASKKNQYPSHYTASRASGYQIDINAGKWCADCVGLIKSFFWKGGNVDAVPAYGSNHCPDTNANGMIKLCSETGPISTIPDIPGLVVWKDGHIGVYVGNGYTVEMKGFDYDCQRNKVTAGPWVKWGRLPASMITYSSGSAPVIPEPDPIPDVEVPGISLLGTRILRRGNAGADVEQLQKALVSLGYDVGSWGADGDFGSATDRAVRAFQRDHGLDADGEFGPKSLAALKQALADVGEPEQPETPVAPTVRYVEITGGTVNIRSAPSTNGRIIGMEYEGQRLPYQGESRDVNGTPWHLVEYQNENAWVSGKYSKLMEG